MATSRVISTAAGSRPEAFGLTEWGLLAAAAGIWGASFLFIDVALESFSPGVIALGRIALGTVSIALLPASRRSVERGDWPRLATLGFCWMGVPLLLFPIAQQWIDSALAGMLNGAVPLFAAGLAATMLRRLPRRLQVLGLSLGFAGVVLVALPDLGHAASTSLGIGLVLLATFLYGLSINLAVPLQQKYGAVPVLFRAQLVALALLTPVGLASVPSSRWSWSAAASVAVLGAFGTGLAFAAMATLAGRAGAIRGSVAIYFIPIVAVVLGVTFRGDTVALLSLVGVVLVLSGAYLSSRREA